MKKYKVTAEITSMDETKQTKVETLTVENETKAVYVICRALGKMKAANKEILDVKLIGVEAVE